MLEGSCLLIDEISLADDAVLERLNSVLEPERTLLVAEKGCSSANQPYLITAQQGFVLMATMNPGGDYGKKEVSILKSHLAWKFAYTNRKLHTQRSKRS